MINRWFLSNIQVDHQVSVNTGILKEEIHVKIATLQGEHGGCTLPLRLSAREGGRVERPAMFGLSISSPLLSRSEEVTWGKSVRRT